MSIKIKYLAQISEGETGDIIETCELKEKEIVLPQSFDEFGLRHKEQIELIKAAQDAILKHQVNLISNDQTCPKCGNKAAKRGKFGSNFHDVFTDHRVTLNRLICQCGWKSGTRGRVVTLPGHDNPLNHSQNVMR